MWGQVSREGSSRGKTLDARLEPREQEEPDFPAAGCQQVRFGSSHSGGNGADPGEPEEGRPRSSRSAWEGRHTTSTPTGSDREQRLKKGWKKSQASEALASPHRRRGERCPLDDPAPGGCIPAPRSRPTTNTTATTRQAGGGEPRAGQPLPSQGSRTSGGAGTSGTGRSDAERTVPRKGSLSALAGQPQRDQGAPGRPRGRRDTWTRRGTGMRAQSTS